MNENEHVIPRPLLLVEGGPLFRIQERVGLINKNVPRLRRAALLAALLAWLPLFILSVMQGTAYKHSVAVPFLYDFGAYSRFLLALPLLLLAEDIIGPRIAQTASHFVRSGVVLEKDYSQFDRFVELGLQARDSVLAEILLLVLAYVSALSAFHSEPSHISTWSRTVTDGHDSLTWAGVWLVFFCIPLYHFLILRWLWRIFVWFQFLNRTRKLDLQLYAPHPDRAAGLGFVGEGQGFFSVLPFAFSLGSVGVLAREIVFEKIPSTFFTPAISVYVVIILLIIFAPLMVFSRLLFNIKRMGLHQYGSLATAYSRLFQKKWIGHQNPQNERLLGTADIQSLADLGNSYEFVDKMIPLPINIPTILQLIVATLLPLTPLLLTVMPLKSILKLLFKMVT